MAWVITIVLLAWPAVEIAAFIEVARWVGLLGAVAGIVLSGLAGIALLRIQGLATARRVQAQLALGQMPVAALFDGACLAVAGLLLLLPGFVSDLFALAILLPPVRHLLRTALAGRLRPVAGGDAPGTTRVIEGEWEVVVGEEEKRPADHPPRRRLN